MSHNPWETQPYSEKHGDLLEYLKTYDGFSADNLFSGADYFITLKDKGIFVPFVTTIRVNRSPIPDLSYFVNNELKLESKGSNEVNMSCILAEKGVYEPDVLEGFLWSVYNFDLSKFQR